MPVRSYPLRQAPDSARWPRGLFDPRWSELSVSAYVGLELFRRYAGSGGRFDAGPILPLDGLPQLSPQETSAVCRPFGAPEAVLELGCRVRAAAHNELHRRYVFGGTAPTRNFHAQVAAFAVDDGGRYLLRATLGTFGGQVGESVTLLARVSAEASLGGLSLKHVLGAADQDVMVAGRDPALASAFESLASVELVFAGPRAPSPETGAGDGERERMLDEALASFER